jgi:small-conductance mechanosensitive channel/CRP-like cAMP-binding protein
MNPTALQNLLGLGAASPDQRLLIESVGALAAAVAAVAIRRRRTVVRPVSLMLVALGFTLDLANLSISIPTKLQTVLDGFAVILFAFGGVRLLFEAIDAAVRHGRSHVSTIFKDLVMLLLYAVIVLLVLRIDFKVDVGPLLATSAVATVVIGLALQETLGNIFSGLTLQVQKPFEPGDWVRSADHEGRVLGVGWRSTSVLTLKNERLEIPNAMIAKDVLVNYAAERVCDEISLGISYLEPPNRVREVMSGALRDVPGVLRNPEPEVLAWEYGDSAIRYRVKYWISDYGERERIRDRVTTTLWYVLRRHAMEIPYPIRTLDLRHTRREREAERRFEQSLIEDLRKVDFLKDLTAEKLSLLVANTRIHQFGAGEVIVQQGEKAESFFILRRGIVAVSANGQDGRNVHIVDLAPPSFFGEIALMTGDVRNATVRARTDVEVLEMGRDAFNRLFHEHPEVATRMSEVIAARITETQGILASMPKSDGGAAQRNWLLAKMRAVFDL